VGESTGYDYSRLQNPTRESLEKTVAALEGGTDALAFSTGMSALSVLMELVSSGEHVIASCDLYGGSVRLLDNVVKRRGISVQYLQTGDISAVEQAMKDNTKAVFVESPTNPMMQITDLAAISSLCKKRGILMFVDNTFMTPIFQQPLSLGADVVLHSGTKYLGGHNDTLAGFLVTANAELSEKLRFFYKTIGACLAPWDSFLIQRGIKTLALRMERITDNAKKVAAWLETQPKIQSVLYPGKSGMVTFTTDNADTARQILGGVKTILFAESLGGVESLITYPIMQTHADVPVDVREQLGITDRLLRLSVGIEAVDDIIADLENALL
jgi:cystathionine gamma-synthase